MNFQLGLKTCQMMGNSVPLRKLGSEPYATLIPGCELFAKNDRQYFECLVRSIVVTMSHYVGTSKMGDPGDPTTVVDPRLR